MVGSGIESNAYAYMLPMGCAIFLCVFLRLLRSFLKTPRPRLLAYVALLAHLGELSLGPLLAAVGQHTGTTKRVT